MERPFYYLEEHLLRGLEVSDLSELDGLLEAFALCYNARPHSSLQESPDARFEREKAHLRPLPSVDPAHIYTRETRKVSNDGYVSCDGLLYPVPMAFCLRDVMVEGILGFGRFYRNDEIAAVLDECIRLGAYHKNTVKRLLGERDFKIPITVLDGLPIRKAALDIARSLSAYRMEVNHA